MQFWHGNESVLLRKGPVIEELCWSNLWANSWWWCSFHNQAGSPTEQSTPFWQKKFILKRRNRSSKQQELQIYHKPETKAPNEWYFEQHIISFLITFKIYTVPDGIFSSSKAKLLSETRIVWRWRWPNGDSGSTGISKCVLSCHDHPSLSFPVSCSSWEQRPYGIYIQGDMIFL
jgi:hypothetical protein